MEFKSAKKYVVFVLCTILLNVDRVQPRSAYRARKDTKVFKIPTPLQNKTTITITGKLTFSGTLYMNLISKQTKEEICGIIFNPSNGNIIAKLHSDIIYNDFYNITQTTDPVTFSLKLITTSLDSSVKELISIIFESNDAGETFVEHCVIDSLSIIDKITLIGAEHVQRLSFEYSEL